MRSHFIKSIQVLIIASVVITGSLFSFGRADAAIEKSFWVKNLIELPQSDYDAEEAGLMIDRLLNINPEILEGLVYQNVKIRLVNNRITDEPEYAHLKGITPRGWESTGYTWDDIPGVGGNPVIVRIGYSDDGNMHGSYNLELHETLHIVDFYLLNNVSSSDEFLKVFRKEAQVLFAGNHYEEVYPEEYFAEVACMYFLNDTMKDLVKTKLPDTYAFLDKLFKNYNPSVKQIEELKGHWAAKDLERLTSLRVMNGFSDGTIRPNESVSREQFIKLLIESIGAPINASAKSKFNDVSDRSWSTPYIDSAISEGIINQAEYSGAFEPSKTLTRAEMAIWIARALKLQPDHSSLSFVDKDLITSERELIAATINEGIMNGMPGNKFDPNGLVTRAQAAVVLNRILNR